ncbi:hypothetical protein E3J84_02550 [Candidatus Aerophobetes bacterium]|uniref:Secretin/TonB short N-terminal domain-containing protein n=1 Tax=Aerophobetes bacterium TaxID=2030807 RepID=A0A523S102_UNCAE|nr:MAG: hypothetical protein E3J84_02550 [Candidatus Aerophobetes bacterium]
MHKKRRGFKKKMVFALTILAIFFISLSTSIWGKDVEKPLISLNVVEMSIYDVLRLIAKEAGLNMVIKKEVRDEVTLRVKNANLWQVLETILENTGFTYQKKDGIIIITELEKIKEEASEEKPLLVTEIIFLNYLQAADVKGICQRFLSPSGIIFAEPRINALIIIDIPENIRKIEQLTRELNIRPSQFLLTGIISDSESSLAMINRRVLRVGETIEGVTVTKIEGNTVTLEKEDVVVVLVLR